jgi:hypothetical protein
MHRFIRSTVLGVGLLVGVSAIAHAQSVSALPPTSPETAPTATMPPVSSAKIIPSPGNNGEWKNEHYTAAPSDTDPGRHPYSTPRFGPAPN